MSLRDRRWLRLGTLVAMYVAQGIPWGFTALTIPAYLQASGMSEEAVGIALASTTLPFAFKWIWGPIIDRFTILRFGRRRTWIIVAQALMALTIGAMLMIDNLATDLTLVAQLITVHTVFNALQDVAVDAYAVDTLAPHELGRVNGLMYGAKYGGGAIGGAGLSWVIGVSSLSTALAVQVAMLLVIMLLPIFVLAPDRKITVAEVRARVIVRGLAEVFGTRSAFMLAIAMLTMTLMSGLVTTRSYAIYGALEWSREQITQLTGAFAVLAGALGAAAGGFLADRFGSRRITIVSSLAMAAGWLVFALGHGLWHHTAFVYTLVIWETVMLAMMSVGLFAMCMGVAFKPAGATQFASYMAMSNFATSTGYSLVEYVAHWSFTRTYLVAVSIQVAVTGLLFVVDPGQTARELPRPAGERVTRGYVAVAALALVMLALTWRGVRRLL